MRERMEEADKRRAWIVTWVAALLPLLGWWLYGLFDLDEGFYGAVAAEMNRRGEWITPYFNGSPWFEKPILLYWAAKPCIAAFGTAVGPRLPSVLATLATYLLIAWFARRRWDEQTARLAVLVAASSLLVVGIGRMMLTDALLNLCLTGAFIFFWESIKGNPRWRLLSAFFIGLSVLAKGPVGIILWIPVAAFAYWRERDLRPRFRGWWILGLAILAATIACWYVPAYLANREVFVQKFLIEQNLNRFTGGDAAHNTPLWSYPIYYPLVLLIGMAPWSFFFPRAMRGGDPDRRFLLAWALVPLIFFSLSRAKLPHYALPACVPLAILVALYLRQRLAGASSLRQLLMPLTACIAVAALVNVAFISYYNLFHREIHRLALVVKETSLPDEDVAAYQMGHRDGMPPTTVQLLYWRVRLNETDHPSIVMILDRVISNPATLSDLLADPRAVWVLTRSDRISDADLEFVRRSGRELSIYRRGDADLYRLYLLTAAKPPRTRRSFP